MEQKALTRGKLYNFLAELKTSPGEYVTLYVRPSSFPHYINELALEPKHSIYANEIEEVVNTKDVIREAEKYNTGAAIFWNEGGNKHIVLPPFPIRENKVSLDELDTSLLYEALEREYTIGIVLVTWGSYSVGIFCQDALIESKAGTGYIHKEHRKGGKE